jgi:hypothetical protein
MNNVFAERELMYSAKGGGETRPLVIRVYAPIARPLAEPIAHLGMNADAECRVEVEGGPILRRTVRGIDQVHALQLAVDFDGWLRAQMREYDLFWPTGENYFD